MSHLHDLVEAARISAEAKDMVQVKKYLEQMKEFANNLDDQEKAQEKAQKQAEKQAAKTASHSAGDRATGGASEPVQAEETQKSPNKPGEPMRR